MKLNIVHSPGADSVAFQSETLVSLVSSNVVLRDTSRRTRALPRGKIRTLFNYILLFAPATNPRMFIYVLTIISTVSNRPKMRNRLQ